MEAKCVMRRKAAATTWFDTGTPSVLPNHILQKKILPDFYFIYRVLVRNKLTDDKYLKTEAAYFRADIKSHSFEEKNIWKTSN
jgi:hypothetical protein